MRKTACFLSLFLTITALFGFSSFAKAADDWDAEPVIIKAYESGKEQIIVEWEGRADFYYVYLDGKKAATVNLNYAILNVKRGQHRLQILPIKLESKGGDSTFGFNVNLPLPEIVSNFLGEDGLEASANVDLSAFGIDPKNILQGKRSPVFALNYNNSPVIDSVPEIVSAITDFDDNVILSLVDKYNSDSYEISVKSGKDVTNVVFDRSSALCEKWIEKSNSNVTVILDRDYLKSQGCMIPELGDKYSFTVRLGKYAINMVTGEPEATMLLGSKESKTFSYTPTAAWKTAPEINYASQTADGQVTLRWEHETNGLQCEYEIVRVNRLFGVRKGTEVLGKTEKHEFVINDLMNEKVGFEVVPVYAGERGDVSDEATVEISNSWVVAPELFCEALPEKRVQLTWNAASGVESYHIVVYAGSGSLLRFVNLDYKLFQEYDIPAKTGKMEYIFEYGDELVTDNGVRLRFEVYAIRHAANGKEQRSSVSKQSLQIR